MAGRKSIRADQTPPRKTRSVKQMIDIRGFPLTTEQGAPLTTEKDAYRRSEYGKDTAPSVVVDSDSYQTEGLSTANAFSKGDPAALPIIEQFAEQSEVSRTLLGINRETTQQGLFGNVSTYGLDPKDWRIDSGSGYGDNGSRWWWTRRPSATGNYYPVAFDEDERNAAIVLSANPTPFLEPPRPDIQSQLINPSGQLYTSWGQYVNSIVALYLFRYMVSNFSQSRWEEFNLLPTLSKYPPIDNGDGTFSFNELYWDKLWLDIQQLRFGSVSNYPIIPSGKAYNFNTVEIPGWRSTASLWGSSNVFITEANNSLPADLDASWDSFFFSTTRVYYPAGLAEDRGHFRIKTNPTPEIWEKYHGLKWDELRQDLKDWEFTVHANESTVTDLEKELKLPYFVLDTPIEPDTTNNVFSNLWPSQAFGSQINLPTNSNRIGGTQGVRSEITLKSIRAFRYQPGRISGFTYGVKLSEIGAGPGTVLEFGIENDTDSYMFRLTNGALFSVVRRSTVPLEDTPFLNDAEYGANTRTVVRNGQVQYETVIEQKIMNGDPLSGNGETGYILNPDTVTMYKIEFGWYGAIGARFYAYVPVENDECRWVTMHTLVIENQLGRPCLADPFFYFKYRLLIQDSSAIRIDQYVHKFGASYYIDGYDEGTLYSLNAQSKVRYLPNPGFSESKTRLNAIDWTTVMGIKPRQFVVNRYGTQLYNKKEIFPENFYVYSQQDCEIKVIRQKGCPEWAFTHQEGYQWNALPEDRRLKGKFLVVPYLETDFSALGIAANDATTHTAVVTYNAASAGGFRNPSTSSNWNVIGDQVIRILGDDLYALFPATLKDFSQPNTVSLKLYRDEEQNNYLSSRKTLPADGNVYLPFTYPLIDEYAQGYDIEFDYFRRDQILLSAVDVLSDEFYVYWVGGSLGSVVSSQASSLRVGFVWPSPSSKTIEEYADFLSFPDPGDNTKLYKDLSTSTYYNWGTVDGYTPTLFANVSDSDWGIESNASYDGLTFTDGLPYDFAFDYPENTLYVETSPTLRTDTYNLESGEFPNYYFTDIDYYDGRLSVPGTEGGLCRGLLCKAGRELRDNVTIIEEAPEEDGATQYYISDLNTPWPNLGSESFTVTIVQGGVTANATTTGGQTLVIGDVTQYVLPISLPAGIGLGPVKVYYNIVYIATMNKRSEVRNILVSKIAPGNIPFIRPFIQARQGAKLGGVWVGQKTSFGIDVRPFTPHRSTVSLADDTVESQSVGGPLKMIQTYTHIDPQGTSTAPTLSTDPLDTYKSVHTSPKKCGSFLAAGGVNAAGIFSASDYPVRWLTSNEGTPLATYYVSANTPTNIDLNTVFNVSGESIVNEDDGNLATFFIARSLGNHANTNNEIYMSLNYSEQ